MSQNEGSQTMRRSVYWLIVGAASLYALFHFGFIIWQAVRDGGWLIEEIVKKHYATIIVLPSFGFAALCLIILLDRSSGEKIRFKALGFEFTGAAGPIVLWIACFLACACAIRLTW